MEFDNKRKENQIYKFKPVKDELNMPENNFQYSNLHKESILKKSILILMTVTISLLTIRSVQASDFSNQGSAWLGGGLSYSSIGAGGDDYRLNLLQVAPILRFFPVDHFMIGPSLSWTGMFVDEGGINQFGIGADIGGVFNVDDKLYPYIRSGGNISLFTISDEEPLVGFSLPIAFGFIIPVGKIFALQIEPSFTVTWVEGENLNVFNISIGICGIGEKAAVSVLQGMTGITSLFY